MTAGEPLGGADNTGAAGTGAGTEPAEVFRSLLAVPDGEKAIFPEAAAARRPAATWAGVEDGYASRKRAHAPATWGVAIDVPERMAVALFEV